MVSLTELLNFTKRPKNIIRNCLKNAENFSEYYAKTFFLKIPYRYREILTNLNDVTQL